MDLKTAFMDYRMLNEDVRRMSRRELRREVVYLTVHGATLAEEKHALEQALDRHITLVAELKTALRRLLDARIDGVEDPLPGGAGGAGNDSDSGPAAAAPQPCWQAGVSHVLVAIRRLLPHG